MKIKIIKDFLDSTNGMEKIKADIIKEVEKERAELLILNGYAEKYKEPKAKKTEEK